jgi:hypothetical protein
LWVFLTAVSNGIDATWLPASWRAGFGYEVDNDAMPTATYLAVHFLATVLVGVVVWWCWRRKIVPKTGVILFFAIAMRLIAMVGEPIHESDFYRYVWDGKSALAGVNPFRFEPGALLLRETGTTKPFPDPDSTVIWQGREFSADERIDLEKLELLRAPEPEWFDRVSHKPVPTIYPPVAQLVFASAAGVFGWSAIGLKGVLFLFDLGIVLLILSILKHLGKSPAWAILYAWHPLVIKEFSNSAHYDAVPVFFCVLALWLVITQPESVRRAVRIGFVLGLGTLAKYFAILLLPILLWTRFSDRKMWAGVLTFAATVFLGFLPFALWSDVGWARLFEGLRIYGEHWQYNPGAFALFQRALELAGDDRAFRHAGWGCAGVVCGVVAWLALRSRAGVPEKCFAAMGALFVFSPTAFPWYLCWSLAFLPFRPRWSWLLLSLLLPLNYLDFKSEAAAPLAFAQFGGVYVLSGLIWTVFAICWFVENAQCKTRCLMDRTASR